jgi:hypothetical protein
VLDGLSSSSHQEDLSSSLPANEDLKRVNSVVHHSVAVPCVDNAPPRVKERIVNECTSRVYRVYDAGGGDGEADIGFGVDEEGLHASALLVYIHNVRPTTTLDELVGLMGGRGGQGFDVVSSATCLVDVKRNIYSYCLGFRSTVHAEKFYGKCRERQCSQGSGELFVPMFLASLEVLPANRKSRSMTAMKLDPSTAFFELPACPRCYNRLDDSVTCSSGDALWPEVQCSICDLLKAHRAPLPSPSPSPVVKHSSSSSSARQWPPPSPSPLPLSRQDSEEKMDPRAVVTCAPCEAENKVMGDISDSLWVCLLCCNVGCGRFRKCHAEDHYQRSRHRFSVKLRDGYVWDYMADDFVSRAFKGGDRERLALLEEEELGFGLGLEEGDPTPDAELNMIKLNSISQYYTDLLTSQLEKQYEYFETEKQTASAACAREINSLSSAHRDVSLKAGRLAARQEELLNQKANLDRKIDKARGHEAKLDDEIQFYKSVNMSLIVDQKREKEKPTTTKSGKNAGGKAGGRGRGVDLDTALQTATKKWNRILDDKEKRLKQVREREAEVMQAIAKFEAVQARKRAK